MQRLIGMLSIRRLHHFSMSRGVKTSKIRRFHKGRAYHAEKLAGIFFDEQSGIIEVQTHNTDLSKETAEYI